ncbi:MAG: dTDP-4-dehydrorhamnose 3,5-epimerase, partial [Rickettsiales bacterium TMED289]
MMKSFQVEETNLSGLKIIKRSKISDKRGSLSRLFCFNELSNYGWDIPISQINHTHTQKKATIRGMHFQKKPYREIKLVTC